MTPETYKTDKHGILPALVIGVYMVWLNLSSGRHYDSPSGVLYVVGTQTRKIIFSIVYKNQCQKCSNVDELQELMDDGNTNKDAESRVDE